MNNPVVLVVEDQETNIAQWKVDWPRTEGYHFRFAQSLNQAMEILQKCCPDVALVDISLPKDYGVSRPDPENGKTLLSVLNRLGIRGIFALTGSLDPTIHDLMSAFGLSGIIGKPILSFSDIEPLIRRALVERL